MKPRQEREPRPGRAGEGARFFHIGPILALAGTVLAVSAVAWALSLTDPSGHLWDIDEAGTGTPPGSACGSGRILNGTSDAYDYFGFMCVTTSGATLTTKCVAGDVYCGGSTYTTELSGRQLALGEDTLQGLTVQRRVYVTDSTVTDANSFVRYLDSFTNTTGSPITVQVRLGSAAPGYNNLGSDSSTTCITTDDGDTAVEITDRWITTDDSSTTSGDPSLGFVVQGTGASETVDFFALNPSPGGSVDELMWAFDGLTVPAGTTIAILTFMIQDSNQTLAQSESAYLAGTPAEAIAGLTGEQLTWIRNFAFCSDCDGDGYTVGAGDCNDWNDLVHPGITTDFCDGEDNDCDTSTPDGASETWYGTLCDGSDSDLCEDGFEACIGGSRGCNDDTASILDICDGADNDCNPSTPDGSTDPAVGAPCDGSDLDLCREGTGTCVSGSFVCTDTTGDTPDLCDGTNDDCDTSTPDGSDESWYGTACDGTDTDLCELGTYDCVSGTQTCVESGTGILDVCDGADNDCNPATPDGYGDDRVDAPCDGDDPDFCAEGVGQCISGAFSCTDTMEDTPEMCDRIDNDCDETSLDGVDEDWYLMPCDGVDRDLCEEGTYDCVSGTQVCSDISEDNIDYCDTVDNDCNPETPDGSGESWDGEPCDGPDTDLCAEGRYHCTDGAQTCDDFSSDNYEQCNGVDDDCNPTTLETMDQDGDTIPSCSGDCNDGNAEIYPGAVEVCDGIDNDCNPLTDHDNDGDGYRDCDGDCAPVNPAINPDAEEICSDGLDNDCDDLIDGLDPDCGGGPGIGDDSAGCSCSSVPGAGRGGLVAGLILLALGLMVARSRRSYR